MRRLRGPPMVSPQASRSRPHEPTKRGPAVGLAEYNVAPAWAAGGSPRGPVARDHTSPFSSSTAPTFLAEAS
jgi:hypothetical protein